MHMQKRRSVAIATALILLCVGMFARHHEAEAAHVREQSGRIVHAQELAEHHDASTNAHLHGRELHKHAGECGLLAIAYAPAIDASAPIVVTPAAQAVLVAAEPALHVATSIAAYRFAPKTSPPSA
jgi:hypothetical protein